MSLNLNPFSALSQVASGVLGAAEKVAEATPVGAAAKAATDIL